MHQRNSSETYGDVMDAISSFLASAPEGVPAEIIEAFDRLGRKDFLPPKLFLEAVEQAPVAISITDPNARILYVNSVFETLTGYPRDQVLGQNESMLSSKSTPAEVYRTLWEAINAKQVWQGKLVNARRDGQEYLAELVIAPVLNAEGGIAYFLGMHRDITEVHQLEQRLKFQKALTEAALDAAPQVVVMVGTDGRVLLDNLTYKALLGDFRGVEPVGLFIHALEQQAGLSLASVCKGGQSFTNVEIRIDPPGKDQARWFSCSGVRVEELDVGLESYFKGGRVDRRALLLLANEITVSRKRLNEARLNLVRASMAEQQMVQTMREAISASIFKLQAPLNVIRAALNMLEAGADQKGLAHVLTQALESGDEAIDSLHASLPSASVEQESRVNLNEILHEVVRLSTDRLLAAGVVVDWRPAPVLPALTGRANALRGLFKYLIDNAMQAVTESGRDHREIRIDTRIEGDELLTELMDNGPGLPASYALRVFEPFFSGWDQPRGHAGMGLTLAQEIAINHGGSIEIDASFLGGCRVFVRLPCSKVESGVSEGGP